MLELSKVELENRIQLYQDAGSIPEVRYLLRQCRKFEQFKQREELFNELHSAYLELPYAANAGNFEKAGKLLTKLKQHAWFESARVAMWDERLKEADSRFVRLEKAFAEKDLHEASSHLAWLKENGWDTSIFSAEQEKAIREAEETRFREEESSFVRTIEQKLGVAQSQRDIEELIFTLRVSGSGNESLHNEFRIMRFQLLGRLETQLGIFIRRDFCEIFSANLLEPAFKLIERRYEHLGELETEVESWKAKGMTVKQADKYLSSFSGECREIQRWLRSCKEHKASHVRKEQELESYVALRWISLEKIEELSKELSRPWVDSIQEVHIKKYHELYTSITGLKEIREKQKRQFESSILWWFQLLFAPWSALRKAAAKHESPECFLKPMQLSCFDNDLFLFSHEDREKLVKVWKDHEATARKYTGFIFWIISAIAFMLAGSVYYLQVKVW